MSIPPEIIESIRERVNLAEIIGEDIQLKRSGRNLVGLCPFHSEKTPSFNVREEENTYHCFGCSKSGSAFDYIMETKGFTFVEAVNYLAARIGVKIPQTNEWSQAEARKLRSRTKKLRMLLELAARVYAQALVSSKLSPKVERYLQKRKIFPDTVVRFRLGYAPPGWNFIHDAVWESEKLESLGFSDKREYALRLKEAGLIRERQNETPEILEHYDTFRGRLLFPIMRSDGAVIAFGGRVLEADSNSPKYINSPESAIYEKRRTFYGLPQALPEIRKTRHAYLVEGYFDVLSFSQRGLTNTIATCGTALTAEHVAILKRFCNKLTIVFDADAAGRKAAAQSFQVFINSGIEVNVALLEAGQDPDSFARDNAREQILEFLKVRCSPILELYLEQLFVSHDASPETASAAVRGKVAEQFVRVIAKASNPVEREALLVSGAQIIGVSAEPLVALLKSKLHQGSERMPSSRPRYGVSESKPRASVSVQMPTERGVTSAADRWMERFCRELLVAVIVEPPLAKIILNAKSVEHLAALTDVLPKYIQEFLQAVEAADPASVIATDVEVRKQAEQTFWNILQSCGLAEEDLLREASNLGRVGGFSPEKFVEEARRLADRLIIRQDVMSIRAEEQQTVDDGQRESLAQSKLMSRRKLESLPPRDS